MSKKSFQNHFTENNFSSKSPFSDSSMKNGSVVDANVKKRSFGINAALNTKMEYEPDSFYHQDYSNSKNDDLSFADNMEDSSSYRTNNHDNKSVRSDLHNAFTVSSSDSEFISNHEDHNVSYPEKLRSNLGQSFQSPFIDRKKGDFIVSEDFNSDPNRVEESKNDIKAKKNNTKFSEKVFEKAVFLRKKTEFIHDDESLDEYVESENTTFHNKTDNEKSLKSLSKEEIKNGSVDFNHRTNFKKNKNNRFIKKESQFIPQFQSDLKDLNVDIESEYGFSEYKLSYESNSEHIRSDQRFDLKDKNNDNVRNRNVLANPRSDRNSYNKINNGSDSVFIRSYDSSAAVGDSIFLKHESVNNGNKVIHGRSGDLEKNQATMKSESFVNSGKMSKEKADSISTDKKKRKKTKAAAAKAALTNLFKEKGVPGEKDINDDLLLGNSNNAVFKASKVGFGQAGSNLLRSLGRVLLHLVGGILKFVAPILGLILIIGSVVLLPLMVILGCFGGYEGSSVSGAGHAEVSELVRSYEPLVREYCEKYGIPDYVELALAMIQQESSGNPPDVMQSYESPYNNPRQPIDSVETSINYGIQELRDVLHAAGVQSPSDIERISLAIQGYNYGNGYISWAINRDGGYTAENAQAFSDKMKAQLGWSVYGDPEYVPHVLRYYKVSGAGMVTNQKALEILQELQENNEAEPKVWQMIQLGACLIGNTTYGPRQTGDFPAVLDCSGFVSWAYVKAGFDKVNVWWTTTNFQSDPAFKTLKDKSKLKVGDIGLKTLNGQGGTVDSNGHIHSDNHVGIYCGKLKNGTDVWLHCTSGSSSSLTGNSEGVMLGAYTNFSYFRRYRRN